MCVWIGFWVQVLKHAWAPQSPKPRRSPLKPHMPAGRCKRDKMQHWGPHPSLRIQLWGCEEPTGLQTFPALWWGWLHIPALLLTKLTKPRWGGASHGLSDHRLKPSAQIDRVRCPLLRTAEAGAKQHKPICAHPSSFRLRPRVWRFRTYMSIVVGKRVWLKNNSGGGHTHSTHTTWAHRPTHTRTQTHTHAHAHTHTHTHTVFSGVLFGSKVICLDKDYNVLQCPRMVCVCLCECVCVCLCVCRNRSMSVLSLRVQWS